VEHVFSQGRLLISHIRNRLSAQSTRALLCLNAWSKAGFLQSTDLSDVASLPDDKETIGLDASWDVIPHDAKVSLVVLFLSTVTSYHASRHRLPQPALVIACPNLRSSSPPQPALLIIPSRISWSPLCSNIVHVVLAILVYPIPYVILLTPQICLQFHSPGLADVLYPDPLMPSVFLIQDLGAFSIYFLII
jgi:hypothetical protein